MAESSCISGYFEMLHVTIAEISWVTVKTIYSIFLTWLISNNKCYSWNFKKHLSIILNMPKYRYKSCCYLYIRKCLIKRSKLHEERIPHFKDKDAFCWFWENLSVSTLLATVWTAIWMSTDKEHWDGRLKGLNALF